MVLTRWAGQETCCSSCTPPVSISRRQLLSAVGRRRKQPGAAQLLEGMTAPSKQPSQLEGEKPQAVKTTGHPCHAVQCYVRPPDGRGSGVTSRLVTLSLLTRTINKVASKLCPAQAVRVLDTVSASAVHNHLRPTTPPGCCYDCMACTAELHHSCLVVCFSLGCNVPRVQYLLQSCYCCFSLATGSYWRLQCPNNLHTTLHQCTQPHMLNAVHQHRPSPGNLLACAAAGPPPPAAAKTAARHTLLRCPSHNT